MSQMCHRTTGKNEPLDVQPMRHTWATWHYCLHKDLLLLRNEGGRQSTEQMEIYAHKMRPQIEAMFARR